MDDVTMIGRILARGDAYLLEAGGREIELRGNVRAYAGKLVRVSGRWSEEGLIPAFEVHEAFLME
jgi:hypothetical protein